MGTEMRSIWHEEMAAWAATPLPNSRYSGLFGEKVSDGRFVNTTREEFADLFRLWTASDPKGMAARTDAILDEDGVPQMTRVRFVHVNMNTTAQQIQAMQALRETLARAELGE